MADPLPPEVPPLPVPVPCVALTKMLSTTLKDLVVAGIIGYAWSLGKIDASFAIPSLLAVLGVDFGRKLQG